MAEPRPCQPHRPDSPKDLARVIAITRPTSDFSKPEQFELMQGGAGTSKKDVNQDSLPRNPRPTSPSRKRAPSSSAMPFFARSGCRRRRRRRPPTGSARCSTRAPARVAILKDGRGHPPEGRRGTTSRCSCGWPATPAPRKKAERRRPQGAEFPGPGLRHANCRNWPFPACRAKAGCVSTIRSRQVTLGGRQCRVAAQAELFG